MSSFNLTFRFYSICVFTILIYFKPTNTQAQGCSDAGFCTMGAMKPDQHFDNRIKLRLRSIEFSHYLGLTKFDNRILVYTVDFNVAFNDKTNLQIKLPYQYAEGRLGSSQGLGDVSLSLSYNLVNKEAFQVNATLGTKIPTGTPNQTTASGRSLPMYYQNTLGTYDFIAGISLITRNWLIATGYQRALNRVDNRFLWRDWVGTENQIWSDHYPQANQLFRGDDIMFRVEYNLRFSRFNANTGLLAIYRPTQDRIKVGEREITVDGTDGLALTYLVGFGYKFNVRSAIKVGAGFRLRRRTKNPDGLSREFVNTITYQFNF